MNNIPLSQRKHVAIYGETNAGKSALFNAILGQDLSIVSNHKGTTTDPVIKAMELLPFGPIALIDTAGLNDLSELGEKRVKKTKSIMTRTDLVVYVMDITSIDKESYKSFHNAHLLVLTKCDIVSKDDLNKAKKEYPNAVFTSLKDENSINDLKKRLSDELYKLEADPDSFLKGLVSPNANVILVMPVDSEAPKGRLILPQAQLVRDCLDNNIKALVVQVSELKSAIEDFKNVELVVTDSQAFKEVSELVPPHIKLTSFSLLVARQKGKILKLIEGVNAVSSLKNGSKILIAEGCTHNRTHEDIGRIKIPKLLQNFTNLSLNFDFVASYDFPEDLSDYDLVIHCGGCMLNSREMKTRIGNSTRQEVSITNYGVMLAYLNGILPRACEIFKV